MRQWYVYLVRTGDGALYTGIATDVGRRFSEHEAGRGRCARYLRGRKPLQLVFARRLGDRGLALKAEWRVRKLPKDEKERIVRSRPGKRDLLRRLGIQTG